MKNKDGFTLLEVVISITLISILSLGFLHVFVGYLGITKKSIDYNNSTTTFANLIDSDNHIESNRKEVTINLGNGHNLSLIQHSMEDSESEDNFLYYKYNNN